MKIKIVGAAGGEVTGSAYYVQTKPASVLVDCGLFQGGKKAEALNRPPTTPKQKVDAVLLTHGHLDHTGRLPLLAKRGRTMPVFATPATIAIAPSKPRVVLTHGEDEPRQILAQKIQQRFKLKSALPGMGDVIEI